MTRYLTILLLLVFLGCNSYDRPVFNWNIKTLEDTLNLKLIDDTIILKKLIYSNDIITGFDYFSKTIKDTSFLKSIRKRFYDNLIKNLSWKGDYYFYKHYDIGENKFLFIINKNNYWKTNNRKLFLLQLDKSDNVKFTVELACVEKTGDGFGGSETLKNSIITNRHQLIVSYKYTGWTDITGTRTFSIKEYYDLTNLNSIKLIKIDTIKYN